MFAGAGDAPLTPSCRFPSCWAKFWEEKEDCCVKLTRAAFAELFGGWGGGGVSNTSNISVTLEVYIRNNKRGWIPEKMCYSGLLVEFVELLHLHET